MFATILTLILAISPLAAGRELLASAGSGGSAHGHQSGSSHHSGSSSDHHSASIHCSSTAVSAGQSSFYSDHVKAMAGAFNLACSDDWDGDVKRVHNMMQADGYAYAWAQSFSKATSKCVGTKGTKGCAFAKSYNSIFASAIASGFASAWATAINTHCDCDNFAAAISFGKANKIVQLYAGAYTNAETKVCTKGAGSGSATAYTRCYAYSHASIWAKAIADAVVAGSCHTKLVAKSDIKAKVDIYTHNYASCDSSFQAWKGKARTSGSAYAQDYALHH